MKRTRQEKLRLGVIFVMIAVFFVIATARLVHLQVILGPKYGEIVDRQSGGKVEIPAERGPVYDRHGELVAKNVIRASLYAYPQDRAELKSVARYLEKIFHLKAGTAIKKFRLKERKFSWVQRRMPDVLADQVENGAPRGLYLREESQRAYPFGRVGQQILGFTDIDNRGQSGFEYAYDSLLAGRVGVANVRRDGLRNTFRVKETALVKPQPGISVVLTVDWRLQDIVEEELARAVQEYGAESGQAVFLNCNNGDILAMAHHNPAESLCTKPTKLCAVTDQFEPGSIFKAFTAAALLDAGKVNFADSINCEGGKWRLGRRTLHDDKEHDWLNFREIVELSSNIGVAKCALEMDPDELFEAYRRFGFGQKLRCGLPGETAGRLAVPSRWSDYNIAALAMGHSVAANALQMAAGFAAIANGGELLRPRLLLGYVDENGYVVRDDSKNLIGRAMKKSSVDSLKAFLRGVVERGTAEHANSEVVAIAGKTGTAEIPDLENGGYFKHRFNASFAGFFPLENPIVAGIVVLKNPRPIHYGGWTSGPAFKRIAERYTVLNPDAFITTDRMMVAEKARLENTVEAPDLIGRDISLAAKMTAERGVKLRNRAEEGKVIWQFPPAGRVLFEGDEILVAVESSKDQSMYMADFTGLPIRTVAAFLHHAGVKFTIDGFGRVRRQSIKPGSNLAEKNTVCRLECRPT